MKIVATPRAAEYIREQGGAVWVWLDPHRGLVGSHVWLEAHCEPPGSSRRTKFTRASRRPHRFERMEQDGFVIHYAFGNLSEPEELHFDRKGWRPGTYRLEAYWNGSVFVGDDVPPPVTS
ncbi:MAG: hypothetical protein WB297_13590 [Actinomycetota bacterium]